MKMDLTRWQFITTNGDINFQIVHLKENGEKLALLPQKRYNSHQFKEEGEIVCLHKGNCNAVLSLNIFLIPND